MGTDWAAEAKGAYDDFKAEGFEIVGPSFVVTGNDDQEMEQALETALEALLGEAGGDFTFPGPVPFGYKPDLPQIGELGQELPLAIDEVYEGNIVFGGA